MWPICVHMETPPFIMSQIVTQKLRDEKLNRIPHPPYSPDLSPCDFWNDKGKPKECGDKFRIIFRKNSEEDSKNVIICIFEGVTFEALQMMFEALIKRLEWVIKNHGSTSVNKS